MKPQIILASGSPRRIEMFQNHGYHPVIMPADVEETLRPDLSAKDAVMFLALKKGLYVEEKIAGGIEAAGKGEDIKNLEEDFIIVSADTVVFLDGILGKPEDEEDAFRMLKAMRGRPHYVATGVSIIRPSTRRKHVFCEVTKVIFKEYGDQEILDYIATGEPMDKAGAYAIQGGWGTHVERYVGDYDNIVGFPWSRFEEEYRLRFG